MPKGCPNQGEVWISRDLTHVCQVRRVWYAGSVVLSEPSQVLFDVLGMPAPLLRSGASFLENYYHPDDLVGISVRLVRDPFKLGPLRVSQFEGGSLTLRAWDGTSMSMSLAKFIERTTPCESCAPKKQHKRDKAPKGTIWERLRG